VNLELLRTFLEVAQLRHFGRAAEALHVTQAAVSARIRLLETTLGVRLFDRVRSGIRLTPEGNRLMRHADLLIVGWRKARQEVSASDAREQLAVGGSLRLWDVLLQVWLHRLRRGRPDLALTAESHTPELLTRHLLDGVIDVAFMVEPAQIELLHVEAVAPLTLVLVASAPGRSVAEALGRGYAMVDWGFAHALEHRRLFPEAPEPQLRLANSQMALRYLLAMGGAAYLPERFVRRRIASGRLHRVAGAPVIRRTAYAVFPVRSTKEALVRSTLELFARAAARPAPARALAQGSSGKPRRP
jgi:DNA-binding transcriptional LysR family regulator